MMRAVELRPRNSRRVRRGMYLLPSLFTIGNLFCGYSAIVWTTRGQYEMAAQLIGIAIVLDMLDGRIARLTGATSDFGVEFDSLADVISFGVAPGLLAYSWGVAPLGRFGWAICFLFVIGGAARLARFNIQTATADKRYFVGMPIPASAGVIAATVFYWPVPIHDRPHSLLALLMVGTVAFLMVSRIRYRSFKNLDLRRRRSYINVPVIALAFGAFFTHPQIVLAALAYGYMASALIGFLYNRVRRHGPPPVSQPSVSEPSEERRAAPPYPH